MKLIGQFALGGFGIAAALTCAAFGVLTALDGFHSGLVVDLEWLLIYCVLWGLFGAGIGVALGMGKLLLKRFRPQSSTPPAPTPAADESVWPPPVTRPSAERQISAGRQTEDSGPE